MSSEGESLPVNLGQEYRVKLGKSFTFPEKNAFHSLKYDFKPQSVDSKRPGHLKITGDEAVIVSLPVGQEESVEDYAQFRGPKKTCAKECILIIDRVTGEAILEKISDTVQLKAIRDVRKQMIHRDRSVSPSPYLAQTKNSSAKLGSKPLSWSSHLQLPSQPSKSSLSAPTSLPKKLKLVKDNANHATSSGGQNFSTPPIKCSSSSKTDGRPKFKSHPHKSSHNLSVSSANSSGQVQSKPQLKISSVPEIGFGVDPAHEISPLRSSTNPTPEPPSGLKRLSSTSSSSSSTSSGSSSSDSDSVDDCEVGVPPPTYTSAATAHAFHESHVMFHASSARSTPTSQSDAYSNKTAATGVPPSRVKNEPPRSSPHLHSSLHALHRSDPSSISHTSSGGGVASSSTNQSLPGMPSRAMFLDQSSYPLLNKEQSSTHQQHHQPPHSTTFSSTSHGILPPPPRQKKVQSSSSSSGSDSSSDTSGSSSSDEETNMEVARVLKLPARQMSMSVLQRDLNLSDTGSDSD